ncbi:MAG: GNAT family N-acetyltransferase [Anaerolineales bacterium]
MCQATVYLNGEVIMRDVLMVEPVQEGVRLTALFEPVQVVPAAIRRIEHNEELGDTHVKQFETDVVLRDGSLVHVRPVRSEDRAFLARFIETLSTETLYLRFLHALKPEEAVKELMPGAGQFALLAVREEMVIGHAIYSETLSGKAKPAVVVADAYQGKGLGTILLGQLTQAAIEAGISELEAHVAPENAPMLQVLRELGFPTILKSEPGLIHVTFPTSLLPEALVRFEQREAVASIAAMEKLGQSIQ